MKEINLLLFSLVSFFCNAQKQYNYKAVYELNYRTDSTSSIGNSEQLVLLINDSNDSFFQSYNQYKRDSVNIPENSITSPFISEVIITESVKKKINIFNIFENINTFYNEDIPNNWKLDNKSSSINGIKCNQATLKAYGRNWNACYSREYPFQFGPYFFSGLPGLILSIEDDKKFYQFKLISLKKEINIINYISKGTEVSKDKYYQMEYETNFSGNSIEKNFSFFPADKKEQMKKKYIESAKRKNTLPIDKTMRYIFDK